MFFFFLMAVAQRQRSGRCVIIYMRVKRTWTADGNTLLHDGCHYSLMKDCCDGSTRHTGRLCYHPIDTIYCQKQRRYTISVKLYRIKEPDFRLNSVKIKAWLRWKALEPLDEKDLLENNIRVNASINLLTWHPESL